MDEGSQIKKSARWTIVIFALAATILSSWLTVEKLMGRIDTLAGCGAGSGCANVLGSKWSMVWGIVPVSVFSSLLYLAVIISLWIGGVKVRWFRMLAAWMLVAAAIWFTALQLFVLHAICPYCMVMHGLGVIIGSLILRAECKMDGPSAGKLSPPLLAVVMVSALALIQHFGPEPETHRVDVLVNDAASPVDAKPDIHAAGGGRAVVFLGGRKTYRVGELPHLGSADAEHVIVKYFDYTCEACAKIHQELEKIIAKDAGKLAVIVLPVPLDRSCNPHLPEGVKDHDNACEFAKLSLQVWRADPDQFAQFHNGLFEFHTQPYEVAEAMAYSLVGEDEMAAVDRDWVDAVLRQNIDDYKVFVRETPVMPKILLGGSKVLQGAAKDGETLQQILDQNLGAKK